MKSKDFAEALRQFANVLATSGAQGEMPVAIRDLAAVFDCAPGATVSSLLSRLRARLAPLSAGSPTLGDIAKVTAVLQEFLAQHAKAGILADLNVLKAFLLQHPQASIASLVQAAPLAITPPAQIRPAPLPVREDLVAKYLVRLEEARSDESSFSAVFRDLSSDPEVGKLEAAALAKRFAGSSASAKAAALKKIVNHHRALMTFRAKGESRDGRSAA